MSQETIFGIAIAAIITMFLIGKLFPKRQPKEKHFRCGRCGAFSPHTERTIEAWRNSKAKFFCQTCHANWLQSRPSQGREQVPYRGNAGSGSGCLGIVVLFAIVQVAGYFLVHTYA